MTRPCTPGATLALLLPWLATAHAADGAGPSVELGGTSEGTPALGVSIDHTQDLSDWHPALDLRFATGLLLLPGDDADDNAAWRLTPALRYTFDSGNAFVEAGVGAGLFLETRLESQELSTAFQFENRLAAGVRLGEAGELGASIVHYSNARLDHPNDGFELYTLGYRLAL